LRVGALELDPVSREAWVDGEAVHLTNKEFALALRLAAEPTRVFTREELLSDVWGFRAAGATRTLDSHASRLRRKLSLGTRRFVINVWGTGYRLLDGGSTW
jgi:DNA-binding response OmpR family regulator